MILNVKNRNRLDDNFFQIKIWNKNFCIYVIEKIYEIYLLSKYFKII